MRKEEYNQEAQRAITIIEKKHKIDWNNPQDLTNLTTLNLSHNKITDISFLKDLTNLTTLYLYNNKITDISFLKDLTKLTKLDLSYNQITDISFLKNFTNLTDLNLSNNQIKIFPKELLKLNLTIKLEYDGKGGIILEDNPIEEPPLEIMAQGNEAIKRYFEDLELQGRGYLNEAKLIIVGEPKAGKSTLMECLLDDTYRLNPNNESTLGIVVKDWKFAHPQEANRELTANIWDFGGQEIQYMGHQFFLSSDSVYLLVLTNDRGEDNKIDYWFKIINLLGENKGKYSPVIVIKNKDSTKDNFHFNFDEIYYKRFYPHLQIEVREIDLGNRKADFIALRELIQISLSKLSIMNEVRPAKQEPIRKELSKINENYINLKRFTGICTDYGVMNVDSQMDISTILHKIGSILHFWHDRVLRNFIILNPQWAVDSVYRILSVKEIENSGRFSGKDLDKLWSNYDDEEQIKLLALMKKDNFEICFELTKDVFIAPQFLPTKEATNDFDNSNTLTFRYQYPFMPKGIVSRLIVRLSDRIEDELFWRTGVIIKNEHCRAKILGTQSIEGLKIIQIAINGDPLQRKYLLHEIKKEIETIHRQWFKNIQYDEMVECNCKDCKNSKAKRDMSEEMKHNPDCNCEICKSSKEPTYFKHKTLIQYIEQKERFIKCENGKIKNVDVFELL